MNDIVIDIPESVLLPADIRHDRQTLREVLAVGLYRKDRMSLREARTLVGLDRRGFEELLSKYGISIQVENDLPNILDDIENFYR